VSRPTSISRLSELLGISPEFQKIPVILTSVNPTTDTIIKARNAGASSYLAEPFRSSEIRSRIDTVRTESAPSDEEPADDIANPFEEEEEEDAFTTRVRAIEGLPAFLAGILHDIGKIVQDRYFSDY
tara:strand:+ start:2890 stop:3270 length:381 start_codon:yes stop_codon:yes gene_type:complete